MKKNKLPLVVIEWRDIIGTAGWEKPSEVNPPTFWTVGYLLKDDENTVKIAHTMDEQNNWSGVTAFPRGCIKSIKKLEV